MLCLHFAIFVKYDLLTEYLTMFWLAFHVNKCKHPVFRFQMKTKYQYGKFEHAMLTYLGPIFYEEN